MDDYNLRVKQPSERVFFKALKQHAHLQCQGDYFANLSPMSAICSSKFKILHVVRPGIDSVTIVCLTRRTRDLSKMRWSNAENT